MGGSAGWALKLLVNHTKVACFQWPALILESSLWLGHFVYG
jgi:hypothetical protein